MDWDQFNLLVALGEAGDAEQAINGLQKLLDSSESREDNAGVLFIIGGCHKQLGRFDEARKTLAEARSLADHTSWIHPRSLFLEASMDISQGKWQAGLEKLDTISNDFSRMLHQVENLDLLEEVRRKRGMALYELDRPSDALPLLEEASAVEYGRPTALYYLGRCCYDLGELDKSRESLREALSLNLAEVYQPSAHYVLGLIYHRQGQDACSVRELEWCIEHDERGLVSERKVVTALVNAAMALGITSDVDRYSRMLQEL